MNIKIVIFGKNWARTLCAQ